jgi:hypothetical protein
MTSYQNQFGNKVSFLFFLFFIVSRPLKVNATPKEQLRQEPAKHDPANNLASTRRTRRLPRRGPNIIRRRASARRRKHLQHTPRRSERGGTADPKRG